MYIDSHCHIHEKQFYDESEREAVYSRARQASVKMILIGTSEYHSREAVEYANSHEDTWVTIGVHPHDSEEGWSEIGHILQDKPEKLVGIGEIGLDYFYENSPRKIQIQALEQQLQWASDYGLPVSFHVRDASSTYKNVSVWDDLWPILNNFHGVKGVLHSFTDTTKNLEKALERGFYIGINGISTFSKTNQAMWEVIPLERMLLETDAPFLTPLPHRGKVNEPAFVRHVAEYHAKKRGVELEHLARVTSANASKLFSI